MSSSASTGRSGDASRSKVWLFDILVLGAAALMLLSWFMPWWQAVILQLSRYVQIRPWGLEHNLGDLADFIKTAAMPTWFAPFMWAYLGIALLVLLGSLVAPEKTLRLGQFKWSLHQLLIAGVGFSYIVVLIVAAVYGSIRMDEFWHMKLIGKTYVEAGEIEKSYVEASLQPGYWLAAATGVLLVVLGLLRNKIVGKPQLDA